MAHDRLGKTTMITLRLLQFTLWFLAIFFALRALDPLSWR